MQKRFVGGFGVPHRVHDVARACAAASRGPNSKLGAGGRAPAAGLASAETRRFPQSRQKVRFAGLSAPQRSHLTALADLAGETASRRLFLHRSSLFVVSPARGRRQAGPKPSQTTTVATDRAARTQAPPLSCVIHRNRGAHRLGPGRRYPPIAGTRRVGTQASPPRRIPG